MVSEATRILFPADKKVGMPELNPLFKDGVASGPCSFDTLTCGGIDKFAVNRLGIVASGCLQRSTHDRSRKIWCQESWGENRRMDWMQS